MSVPLQVQLFDAFLGSQEGIHSIILPDIFSSGGSKNVWMDKYARCKKIMGYGKQNATAITTDTGGSATMVRELFPYRSATSGTAFQRTLLGCFDDQTNEFEIWKSTNDGATWTFVQDLGSGSINCIPDFAQLGSALIFCNGVVSTRTFDGTNWGTAAGSQLAAPTLSGSTTGQLQGTYKWKVLPIVSSGARKIASVTSAATVISNQQKLVTWVADPDATVVGYEIYRTTGTGAVFYFVAYVDGIATVTFTDNTPDITILENRVMEEHGDAPPISYRCEAHKQRMWYFNQDISPQRGYWSDAGLPYSVYNQNFIEFADAETLGDRITGALGDFEGRLIVFQERSVWAISGTGEIIGNIQDWSRTKTNCQTGAVSGRSVTKIPSGAKYVDQKGQVQVTDTVTLAYFTPLGDIRLFDGDNDLTISYPKKDFLATLNYSQRTKVFHIHDTARNEITWVFPAGSSGEPNKAVTWNYAWGVFYEREWAFSSGVEIESSSQASILLGGSNNLTTGGRVYLLWSGNSFDGAAFNAQWMTKTLYGVTDQAQPAIAHTKRWRWADFLFQTDQNVTLTVEWLKGNQPDTAAAESSVLISPAASTLLTTTGSMIMTASGSTVVVSAASAQIKAILHSSSGDYLHDTGIRLRIGDTASNGSWSLESFVLAYQLLPGLKRRMQR